MKKLLLPFLAITVASACNNSGDKTAENKDTATHDMHSTAANPNDPPLPEIPADAKVFFVNLKDGQEVKSPLKFEMGVQGLNVDTANGILKPASGHHHLLIDLDSIETKKVVPPTDSVHHLHFGKAQTAGEIKLAPGKHKLTLQFADALHRSYGSRLTHQVTVEVKE
jgi:hypothetical protein